MGEFNFGGVNVTGGGQVVVGQNQGGMHQGSNSAPPTVATLFDSVSKALPSDDNAETQLAHEALNNIESMATAYPDGTPAENESVIKACMRPYLEKLAPFAPTIAKCLLAFGDGYFSTLASKNAIVAGIVEAFKAARQ